MQVVYVDVVCFLVFEGDCFIFVCLQCICLGVQGWYVVGFDLVVVFDFLFGVGGVIVYL